jgi:hypothetical protein
MQETPKTLIRSISKTRTKKEETKNGTPESCKHDKIEKRYKKKNKKKSGNESKGWFRESRHGVDGMASMRREEVTERKKRKTETTDACILSYTVGEEKEG